MIHKKMISLRRYFFLPITLLYMKERVACNYRCNVSLQVTLPSFTHSLTHRYPQDVTSLRSYTMLLQRSIETQQSTCLSNFAYSLLEKVYISAFVKIMEHTITFSKALSLTVFSRQLTLIHLLK